MAVGLVAAALVWFNYHYSPDSWSDIDQVWIGARALVAGENPYEVVRARFPWPLYYPATALLIGMPLAALSLDGARCAFAFVTASVCAWAVLRHHRVALPLLLSGPFLYALQRGQWSPLVLAACLIPWLGVTVLPVKPSVGLGVLLYRPSRLAVLGSLALGVGLLAVWPGWLMDWLAAVRSQNNLRVPLLLPGGLLIGLAVLRWRRPEARLLLGLSLVPQTVGLYELVPLMVVPRTRREVLLVVAAWLAAYLIRVLSNEPSLLTYETVPPNYLPPRWWAILVFGYLPILLLVLRRPNHWEGWSDRDVTSIVRGSRSAPAAAHIRAALAEEV